MQVLPVTYLRVLEVSKTDPDTAIGPAVRKGARAALEHAVYGE